VTDNQCSPAHRSSCRRVKLSSTTSCANLIWRAPNSNWNGASSCRPILQVSSVRRANLSVVELASSPGNFPTGAEPRPRRDRNQPVNIWTAASELALSLLTPLIYKEEARDRKRDWFVPHFNLVPNPLALMLVLFLFKHWKKSACRLRCWNFNSRGILNIHNLK